MATRGGWKYHVLSQQVRGIRKILHIHRVNVNDKWIEGDDNI